MFNLKKEKMKKNICLTISIMSAFILIVGLMCTVMGDDSPVKFIINESHRGKYKVITKLQFNEQIIFMICSFFSIIKEKDK